MNPISAITVAELWPVSRPPFPPSRAKKFGPVPSRGIFGTILYSTGKRAYYMASAVVEANGAPGKVNGALGTTNGASRPQKEEIAWMSPGPAAFDFRSRFLF